MRFEVSGVKISDINLEKTIEYLKSYNFNNKGYICLPDLSVLTAAQKDTRLKEILNNSILTLPDGKPLELLGRIKGYKKVKTVSGYWLIKSLLDTEISHYFYGGTEETCKKLKDKLTELNPNSNIVGLSSPPFLNLEDIEGNPQMKQDIEEISKKDIDIIWIGISSPKQDYLMNYFHKELSHGIMIGVGGVFDYLAENKKISPEWVKKIGLRWLYRLAQEPKRLWKKYFLAFIGLFRLIFFAKKQKE